MRLVRPALAFALTACATTSRLPPGVLTPESQECAALRDRTGYVLDTADPFPYAITGLACFATSDRDPDPPRRAYVQLHARFDERHFDPITAALMVVACVNDGACEPGGEAEAIGQLQFYARSLDPAQLETALAGEELPDRVRTAFAARAVLARSRVLEAADRLDPLRRRIYVELPTVVRARVALEWDRAEGLVKRFDELTPRVDVVLAQEETSAIRLRPLVTATSKLRDEALSHCLRTSTVLDCATGALVRPLTRRLVELAIQLKDPVLAQAEQGLLELGPDQSTLAIRVANAQAEALLNERLPELGWRPARDLRSVRGQLRRLRASVDVVRGTVRFVRARGLQMEIYFEDEPVTELDCALLEPGEPDTAPDCAPGGQRTIPIPRVFLALNEAKPILIGNRLEAVVDRETRQGLAVQVFKTKAGDQLVQVRSVRVR